MHRNEYKVMKDLTNLVYTKKVTYTVYKVKAGVLLQTTKNQYELKKLIDGKCRWIENEMDEPYDFIIGLQFLSLINPDQILYLLHPEPFTCWQFEVLEEIS